MLALTQSVAAPAFPTLATRAFAQTAVPANPVTVLQSNGSENQPATADRNGGTPSQHFTMPFGVGERMVYDVRAYGGSKGEGSMEVREITDVRGRTAWHTVFKVKGRVLFLVNVNITLESWFDVTTMNSLRIYQNQQYAGTKKIQHIEVFPDRGMYKEDSLDERVTVANPLDDGSFLYFVRSVPLEVGQTYSFKRYYKPEKNPVKITVLRREVVKTAAGTFNTLVLKPEIKSGGLFAEGKSQVWVTDDATRMVVKLESDLPVGGTLSLWLTSYKLGTPYRP